ncbi:hypothetical protein [Cupriavidus sp. D39]|uniref:hypothetical protein n=1 Tax=Cupriavidus sp. D39 TaxID=2997877 RepID=UPI002270347B|nr:hypothetical protein [Cupriavidus sp. D39]MCY0853233.1 hypothetical protein [Cupriavidus sp. D39]
MQKLGLQKTEVICTRGSTRREIRRSSQYIPANLSPLGIPQYRKIESFIIKQHLEFTSSVGESFRIRLKGLTVGITTGDRFFHKTTEQERLGGVLDASKYPNGSGYLLD